MADKLYDYKVKCHNLKAKLLELKAILDDIWENYDIQEIAGDTDFRAILKVYQMYYGDDM